MAEAEISRPGLQANLLQVMELLRKQRSAEAQNQGEDARAQVTPDASNAELQSKLDELHPADVAYLLESLPLDDRLVVWDRVKFERDGEILLEVSDAVRESLIAHMENTELVKAAEQLDTDEIADLAPDLPREVMQDVFRSLSLEEAMSEIQSYT